MRAITLTKALASASANAIAHSQTPLAAGYLTLTASPVVLDTQRQVIITSGGDDTGVTFTIIGTDDYGATVKDSFLGASVAAAASNLNFKTVSSIYASAATAAAVTAGTNGVGSTPWQLFSDTINTPNMSFDCELTGTANYSVEYTQDPFLAPIGVQSAVANGPDSRNPTAIAFTDLSAKDASAQAAITFAFHGWRLTINSGTGSVQCTGRQAGLASP